MPSERQLSFVSLMTTTGDAMWDDGGLTMTRDAFVFANGNSRIVVPFEEERRARAVGLALGVDRELQPDVVRKEVSCERSADGKSWEVVATFAASELKALRSAVSSYYDLLAVSVRTVERFDKPQSVGDDGVKYDDAR